MNSAAAGYNLNNGPTTLNGSAGTGGAGGTSGTGGTGSTGTNTTVALPAGTAARLPLPQQTEVFTLDVAAAKINLPIPKSR